MAEASLHYLYRVRDVFLVPWAEVTAVVVAWAAGFKALQNGTSSTIGG